ncbi:DUF2190 family protein [Clostridium sp. KNHs216]|uniref:DUF2190 family protein n=1 Tax=Clostridium sp. KNHs216 TaxID=1550235 RepID=UPI001152E9B0|nr:DUF2190 family protein [Clostridium sp. KNHs216]TQI66739.1 putative RecA/RadA family phage recombinase [Clostridium sp. KNHs216]
MARYIQEGKIINYQNSTGSAIAYGDVLVLTGRIGVAVADIPNGALGSVELEGVFEIPAESTPTLTVGQTVYWDATNSRVTGTKPESGEIVAGIVVEPKTAAESTALVKL